MKVAIYCRYLQTIKSVMEQAEVEGMSIAKGGFICEN